MTASTSLGDKVDLFGVGITVTTYDDATDRIMAAARERESYAVSALAVHGLMEAVDDAEFRELVNGIDLVTPDGQPVRWAMNALHRTRLDDRVYGPDLTWRMIEAAASEHGHRALRGRPRLERPRSDQRHPPLARRASAR